MVPPTRLRPPMRELSGCVDPLMREPPGCVDPPMREPPGYVDWMCDVRVE